MPDTDLAELWRRLRKDAATLDVGWGSDWNPRKAVPIITAWLEQHDEQNHGLYQAALIVGKERDALAIALESHGALRVQRDAALSRVAELTQLLGGVLVAFQLTREYVGEDVLPAIEGWSWFDCVRAIEAALASEETS